jgi:HEAT repeat protein
MGLFGLFGSKEERERGALQKLAKRVKERYGPPENRQKAIAQLGEMGTPAALETLCLRFTTRSEPGITDDEEKETVRGMLVEAGETAVGPLERFIRAEEDGVAWGLRALSGIVPEPKVLAVVVGELAHLGKIYTKDPEKKLVLLTWLREHHAGAAGADLEAALLPLLEDFSDDVRISAVRALVSVSLGEKAREALIELLLRDRDNARVRGEVLEAMAALGADVKGHRPSVEALLVEPFYLDREGRVKKRG